LEARRPTGVILNPNVTLRDVSAIVEGGRTTIAFTRSMKEGHNPIKNHSAFLIASYGNNKQIGHHKCKASDQYFVDFSTSNSTAHVNLRVIHAFLMGTTFTLVYPFGICLARYFKFSLQENWFNFHVGVQLTGLAASITAAVIAYYMVAKGQHFTTVHSYLGTTLMALVLLQAAGGLIRPKFVKEAEIQSFRRTVWEWLHSIVGKLIVLGSIPQIILGIRFFNPGLGTWSIWWPFVAFWGIMIIVLESHKILKKEPYDSLQERDPLLRTE